MSSPDAFDAFLSYARADDPEFVARLHADLVQRGFRIWWDRVDMPNRALTFLQEIRDAIDSAERLIAVVGPAALASDHVRAEWEHARLFGKGMIAIPRLCAYEALPPELARSHGPDFRQAAAYAAALDELSRLLRSALAPRGPLSGVPALSPHFVSRPVELDRLQELVLADLRRPLALAPNEHVFAVVGMAGAGKSVLATALARTTEVRRAFHGGGVIWSSVGQHPRLMDVARAIAAALQVDVAGELALAFATLQRQLEDHACLIVLDDVWEVADVERTIGALGDHCRLLLTTRKESVAAAVAAKTLDLDQSPLSETLARRMLAAYSGQPTASWPLAASEVLDECGRLPFAIALVGSMARRAMPWTDLRDALRAADLAFVEQALPGYPHADLLRAQQVGVADLASDQPDCVDRYFDLVVFPDDVAIPEAAVLTLWSASGLDGRHARKALATLSERSLLALSGAYPARHVSLHDLQHDFLRASVSDSQVRQQRFVDACRRLCAGRWAAAPDDGYFFERYPWHVLAACGSAGLERLLFDFEWLSAKIERCGIAALLDDFALASDPRSFLRYLEDVLRRSAMALTADGTQLAGQLLGHVGRFRSGESLDRLLEQARAWRVRPWLRPLQGTLVPPGSALRATLAGHEGTPRSVAISSDGRWGASAGNSHPDQTLRVWDLDKGVLLHVLLDQAPAGESIALAFAAQGALLLAAFGQLIKVWQVRTGRLLVALERHRTAVTALACDGSGRRLLSASADGSVVLWERAAASGEREPSAEAGGFRVCGDPLAQSDSPPLALALSPNGEFAALRTATAVEVWDLRTRQHRRRSLPAAEPPAGWADPCLAVADDGRRLWFDSWLFEWQPDKDALRALIAPDQDARIVAVAAEQAAHVLLTPDGETLLIGDRAENGLRWRADLPSQLAAIRCATLSPDGRRALVGLGDHRLKVWDLAIVPPLRLTPGGNPARRRLQRIDLCDDESHAVIQRANGDEELLDLCSGEVVRRLDGGERLLAQARARWAAEESLLDDYRQQLQAPTADACGGPVDASAAVIPAGGFAPLVVAARSGWQLKAANRRLALAAPLVDAKYGEYQEADRLADGVSGFPLRSLAAAGDTRTDDDDANPLLAGHTLPVLAVAVADDAAFAISGGDGRTLRVWDLAARAQKFILKGHLGSVHAVALARRAAIAASASEDRTLRVWDLADGRHLATFTGELRMTACALSADGRTVIAGEGDGKVHVLRLELP